MIAREYQFSDCLNYNRFMNSSRKAITYLGGNVVGFAGRDDLLLAGLNHHDLHLSRCKESKVVLGATGDSLGHGPSLTRGHAFSPMEASLCFNLGTGALDSVGAYSKFTQTHLPQLLAFDQWKLALD